MALENSYEMGGVKPHHPHHAYLKTHFRPYTLDVYNRNMASTKVTMPAPANGSEQDPVAALQGQLAKAHTTEDKTKITLAALDNAKGNPGLNGKLMAVAIGETHGADKAAVIGTLMQKDPAATTKVLADMKPEAKSLDGAHLENLPKALVEILPYNMLDVHGATLPANTNLSRNQYMAGANLDGVTAPGLIVPGNVSISAKDANVREEAPANEVQAASVKVLNTGGARTGQQAPKMGMSLSSGPTFPTPSPFSDT